MFTRAEIRQDLAALELPAGATCVVHSSLRKVGWLTDGPTTLAEALWDVLGRESTIVVPTFTARNSTTTREYRRRTTGMTPQELAVEEAKIEAFDRRTTPAQNVGAFPEHIRRRSHAVRSDHPQTSFCAVGPAAAELIRDHALDCHLGEKSPLARLYDNDAIVLLIGVGFEVCSCFHLAEHRLDRPMAQRLYRTYVIEAGKRVLREFYALDTDDRDFARIGREMVDATSVGRGRAGRAQAYWFRLRKAVDFAAGWMSRHRGRTSLRGDRGIA